MTDQPIQFDFIKRDLIRILSWLATLDNQEEAKAQAHQLILNWIEDVDIRAAYEKVLWSR